MKLLNMETLDQRREKGNLNFAKKCLKIENMKSLFPLNKKKHEMKNRKKFKYKVFKVNIPYGQSSAKLPVTWVTDLLTLNVSRLHNIIAS